MTRIAAIGLMLLAWASVGAQPVKPVVPDVTCDTPDGDGNAKRCPVSVGAIVTGSAPSETCATFAPNVILQQKKKVVLVWDLPNGYQFCPALGDGVFLVFPDDVDDGQFDDFGVPDNGVGRPTFTECRNKFRMLAVNSKNAGKQYSYRLQFRRKSGNLVCTADPFIKNG